MRGVLAVLLVVALIAIALLVINHWDDLPPCPTEDSDNCYWDAQTMHDRTGTDSVVITP